ncbi:MAG: T9SS type A sorting domain-containing protein [Bacteroidota bacterium]
MSGLANSTVYYWRVRAKNIGGWSGWSNRWNFTTIIGAPFAPNLITPTNNATNQSVSPTMVWNLSASATAYHIQVATDTGFTTRVIPDDTTLTDTFKNVSGLTNSTIYYWRVRSKNVGGWSGWSTRWSFTTIIAAPLTPNLVTPSNGSTNQPITPTMVWNHSATSTAYHIQIATDTGFTSRIIPDDTTLTDTFKNVSGLTNSTVYYWRVRAKNVGGWSGWSTRWSFTTVIAAPLSPNLLTPANNAINQPVSPTMVWNHSATATAYHIQVATDTGFTSRVIPDDTTLTDTFKNVSGLANSTVYYWRVQAKNLGGWSGWSTRWGFTTIIAAPIAPNLITPTNNAIDQSISPTMVWSQSTTATAYHIQVATDTGFTSKVIPDDTTLTDTFKNVSGLTNSTVYYWRVRAKNIGGWSGWSNRWSFTTIIAAPLAPNLIIPANNATNQSVSPIMLWNHSLTATAYHIQVATDTGFTSRVIPDDTTLTDTFKNVSGLANSTVYYWRVQAKNLGGWSGWSTRWSFTTIIAAPLTPNLITPSNGSTNQPITPTMVWNLSVSATAYHIQVATDTGFTIKVIPDDTTLTDTFKNVNGLTNSTVYYWRVRAKNVGGWSGWSTRWSFTTIIAAPLSPNLITPSNGSTNQSASPTMVWNHSITATAYHIQVATDTGFTSKVIPDDTTLTDTFKNVSGLTNKTIYYWRVRAKNIGGWSGWSTKWSFTTIIAAPGIPVLLNPISNSIDQPTTLMFRWQQLPTTISYHIQVATDTGFTSKDIPDDTTLTDTFKNVSGLTNSTVYYWRVRAKNVGGWSGWSNRWSFTTIIATPPPPNLITPTNGSTNQSVSPTMVWNLSASATAYHIQIATDTGFTIKVIPDDTTLTDTFKNFSGLMNSTVYYWRVRTKNVGGWSGWSTRWSFTTIIATPLSPNLITPTNNATNQSVTPTMVWNHSASATAYNIQVATDTGFTSKVIPDDTTLTDTFKNMSGLTNSTIYYWRVQAKNISGWSGWSTRWSFTTIIAAPLVPNLMAPPNGATDQPASPTMVWNHSRTATSYHIQVATDSAFALKVIPDDTTLTDTFKNVSGLKYNMSYYWRVRAKNAGGWSNWSPTWILTTTSPRMVITVSTSRDTIVLGDTLTYSIHFKNTGLIDLTHFTILDTLHPHLINIRVSPNAQVNGSIVRYIPQTLNAGVEDSIIIIASVSNSSSASEVISNRVIATSDQLTPQVAEASFLARFIPHPSLNLTISVSTDTVLVGDTLRYIIKFGNNGNVMLHSVSIVNRIPSVLKIISTTGGDTLEGNIVWTSKDTMVIGEMDSITVQTNVPINTLDNIALLDTVWAFTNQSGKIMAYTKTITKYPGVPSTPRLIFPSNNSTGQPTTLTLVWHKSINGVSYNVQVATDTAFMNMVIPVDTTLVETLKTVSSLLRNTVYYWRVRSKDIRGWSDWSTRWSFSTIPPTPITPLLIAPADKSVDQRISQIFLWNRAAYASSYRFQIATDSDFVQNIVTDDSSLVDTSKKIANLNIGTTYYWRVRAINAGGWSNWSMIWKLTTASPRMIISKIVSKDTVIFGDTVSYVIHLKNTGIIDLTHFAVVDTLNPHLIRIQVSSNAQVNGTIVQYNPQSLIAGGEDSIKIIATVSNPTFTSEYILNQVFARADNLAPQASEASIYAMPPIHAGLDLQLQVSSDTIVVGDSLIYKITFGNSGNVTLHNVSIVNKIPASLQVDSVYGGDIIVGNTILTARDTMRINEKDSVIILAIAPKNTPNSINLVDTVWAFSKETGEEIAHVSTITKVVILDHSCRMLVEASPREIAGDGRSAALLAVWVDDTLGHPKPDGTPIRLITNRGMFSNGKDTMIISTRDGFVLDSLKYYLPLNSTDTAIVQVSSHDSDICYSSATVPVIFYPGAIYGIILDNHGGAPVQGGTVRLYSSAGAIVDSTISGTDGKYIIPIQRTDLYSISVITKSNFGQTMESKSSMNVQIPASGGVSALPNNNSISGTLYFLNTNAPIHKPEIKLILKTYSSNNVSVMIDSSKTDSTGSYIFHNVAPGQYGIELQHAYLQGTVGTPNVLASQTLVGADIPVGWIGSLQFALTGPGNVLSSDTAVYHIAIQNTTQFNVTNTIVVDTLDPMMMFVNASDNGAYDAANRRVIWNLDTLHSMTAKTLTMYVAFSNSLVGSITLNNHATVTSDQTPPVSAVTSSAVTQLYSPVLLVPVNNAVGQPNYLLFSWKSSQGATRYHLIINNKNTGTVLFNDSNVTSTSIQIKLDSEGSYSWTVCAGNLYSETKNSQIFTVNIGKISIAPATPIRFPAISQSTTDFRMFSLPGIVDSVTIGTILPGKSGIDWRVFRDNGADTNYFEQLNESSTFHTGEGYWLVKNGDFNLPVVASMPSLDSNANYTISLHNGWNIIGNPFAAPVVWSEILRVNTLNPNTKLVTYIGQFQDTVTVLAPFSGYYYSNDVNRDSLLIPYPIAPPVQPVTTGKFDWRLQVMFESSLNNDEANYVGVAPDINSLRGTMNNRKPPAFLDQGSLYFNYAENGQKYKKYCTDFRQSMGDGQVWNFEVLNPKRLDAKIRFKGIEQVPPGYKIMLVNLSNSAPVDLRAANVYPYKTVSEKMRFKLIVGNASFVEKELAALQPKTYELTQNYPNPFNPATSISFSVPARAAIRVEVVNILGQRVSTLAEGTYDPGFYTAIWNGTNQFGQPASSGIYFYRLTADGKIIQSRKMILLK